MAISPSIEGAEDGDEAAAATLAATYCNTS